MASLFSHVRPTVVLLGISTVLFGGLYPALTTLVVKTGFTQAAEGSLVYRADGTVVGSSLIGQTFTRPDYLWGRLSATSPTPYLANASGGSNLGLNNPDLLKAVQGRLDALKAADPGATGPVPVDLVTASASGLDPDISPAAAAYQVHRIALVRKLSEADVATVIAGATKGRTFGILGEPRVNVLDVNLALDALGRK